MKLTHRREDSMDHLAIDQNDVEFKNFVNELREIEEKFYKIFDLNPCPMSINDIEHDRIIDVNQAFMNVIGIKNKSEIVGKRTTEEGLNIVKNKDRIAVLNQLDDKGVFKNYLTTFRTLRGKKIQGIFSGSIIELKGIKCLLTTCQVVNRKCLFKTYFLF